MTSVLLVTPRWTRDGGVATHVMASAAAMAESGLKVSVLAARIEDPESAAAIEGVTLFECPDLYDRDLAPERRVGESMSADPTAIHLHQFDDPDVLSFMRESAPVLVSAHGYTACTAGVHYFRPGQECNRAHGPGCLPNLALRGCAHKRNPRSWPSSYRRAASGLAALRSADLAVSYSSAVDRHLAVNRVPRRTVVPYFPTMAAVSGAGHSQRRRVVFAGRVVAPKGVDVLIRAAREVDGEFVICGDGWRLDAMRALAERLGVRERVRFTGWLDAGALARELAEASVVVVPSLWPEPFGLVGIEAFAAGRPVVASDTGGVRDWLEHDVSGLCVPPGDWRALALALEDLLADPARQAAMGAAGRDRALARFSAERHVSALLDAYAGAGSNWSRSGAGTALARSAARRA